MKQVFMRKNPVSKAQVATEEVPAPRCGRGSVLLANGYSLISAGTESAAVKRLRRAFARRRVMQAPDKPLR